MKMQDTKKRVHYGSSFLYISPRIFLVILCLLCASLLVAQETILNVWGISITPSEKGIDVQIRQFEAENPGVKVRLLSMGAGGMNPQKLMTAIVGNAAPDVIKQDRFTIADWASRGAFQPLDPLVERDRATDPRTPTADQYFAAAWDECVYEGHLYGIPLAADNRALYYNTEVFAKEADRLRKAGLDPTRPPRTWSEMLAYSKVLTEFNPDGTLKRAGFIPNWGDSWLYLYAFQNDASFLSPDGKTCTLNTEACREALQYMVDGYDICGGYENALKFQSGFRSGEHDPFATGKVAMAINGDWMISNYARNSPNVKFKTAPAPVPDDRYFGRGRFKGVKDQFITWSGGFSLAIPRGAKNPELAWKFIKFMSSFEGRKLYIEGQAEMEAARGRRYIPKLDAHIKTMEYMAEKYASGDSQFESALRTHMELMSVARMRPTTFAGQKLWDEHVRATEQACRKDAPVGLALQRAEDRVQDVIDEFYSAKNHPVINVAVPVACLFVAVVVGLSVWIWVLIKQAEDRVSKQETKAGYLFISPWILGFLIFVLGPMLASFVFAFLQYDVLNEARYVGLANFADIFGADRAINLTSLRNVGYLAIIGIPLGLSSGLAVALLLNQAVRGLNYYRTAFYLPSIVPSVASTFLWMWILLPDDKRGLLNYVWAESIYRWFGVAAPGWFTSEQWAKPALILMGLWGIGGGMILWLAGLKGVPATLYEAAGIDGASPWKQFWKITLPQLTPLLLFNSIVGFIAVLQTFDSVYIITRGEMLGPNDTLATPVYLLFNNGFAYFRMGYASALAWILFLIVVAVTFIQLKISRKWVHYEVDQK